MEAVWLERCPVLALRPEAEAVGEGLLLNQTQAWMGEEAGVEEVVQAFG